MPLLTEADILRAKYLVEAHAELVQQYRDRMSESELGFLNVNGHEVPDDTVVEPPIGYIAQPDLIETIRNMVRSEQLKAALDAETETFEEADDFDVDDDFDPMSPYEMFFDPQPGAARGPSDLATDVPTGLSDPQSDTAAQSSPEGSSEPERGGGGAERPPSAKQTASP